MHHSEESMLDYDHYIGGRIAAMLFLMPYRGFQSSSYRMHLLFEFLTLYSCSAYIAQTWDYGASS